MALSMVARSDPTGSDRSVSPIGEETNLYWSLSKCRKAYEEYLGSKQEEIREAQAARCYRHGAQWTTDQVEVFNRRKQPVVTYNRIGRKIDAIVGLMERLKQDPKAYPRNPRTTDEQGSELATAVVRYVVEGELRESIFPFGIEQAAMEGIGGVELMLVEGDKGDMDIGFALVQGDSYFYDPRSYLHNFDDARFQGQGKWLDLDDAIAMFPQKREILEGMLQGGGDLTTNPDRERRWFHITSEFKRVRVVDIWYRNQGKWLWTVFAGGGKLDEGPGYFYNEKGKQICKYIMFSSFIDHDGDRYGFVRSLRSSQDEVNQRRSKGLHELNSRRIKAEDGAFADIEVTRKEAVRPDGVVIYNKGFEMEFDDQTRIANVEGQLKFLEDAKSEIENFGPNPALIGQGLEYKSGRAINYLQQAGIAELGPFVIGVKNWKLRLYRAIWCAVQRYWQAERWIRVTNDEGIASYLQVNGLGLDPYGLPRMVNFLGNLDVNFVLDEGPDEVNMMADAYDTLVAMSSQGAKVPPEVLVELAPLHASVKRKLLSILQRPPDPQVQQAQQVELAGASAQVDETKSKAALNMAKAQQMAQGAAGNVAEKQMDMAMAGQQHQAKMAESAVKAQAETTRARLGTLGEFAKLRSKQIEASHDLGMDMMGKALDLQHKEEMHQQKLRQMKRESNLKGYGG